MADARRGHRRLALARRTHERDRILVQHHRARVEHERQSLTEDPVQCGTEHVQPKGVFVGVGVCVDEDLPPVVQSELAGLEREVHPIVLAVPHRVGRLLGSLERPSTDVNRLPVPRGRVRFRSLIQFGETDLRDDVQTERVV
jgi:hypothetical protein